MQMGQGIGWKVGVRVGKRWRMGLALGRVLGNFGCGDGDDLDGEVVKTELGSGSPWRMHLLSDPDPPPPAQAEEKEKVQHGGPCEQLSHPYQAALYNSGHMLCGGVLIHPLWVLTAAHCKKP